MAPTGLLRTLVWGPTAMKRRQFERFGGPERDERCGKGGRITPLGWGEGEKVNKPIRASCGKRLVDNERKNGGRGSRNSAT